jgi:hypothetical protein
MNGGPPMKRKIAGIELILVLTFGVFLVVSMLNRRIVEVDWREVVETDYGVDVFSIYAEQQFELNHYGEWDELGFTVEVYERFHEAPLKAHPDAQVNVFYVLTSEGEKLIYSYPYRYQKQDPKDVVYISDYTFAKTKGMMINELSTDDEFSSLIDQISDNQFTFVPAGRTELLVYAELAPLINERMQDVIFYMTFGDDYLFFTYKDQLFVVRRTLDNELLFLYPTFGTAGGYASYIEELS